MAVKLKGTKALTRGTPVVLFEALAGDLPGIFAGKIQANELTVADDEVKVTLDVKYDTGLAYTKAEENNFKKSDEIFRFTPVEENFGYRLTVELLSASPSSSANLHFVITRTAVVS